MATVMHLSGQIVPLLVLKAWVPQRLGFNLLVPSRNKVRLQSKRHFQYAVSKQLALQFHELNTSKMKALFADNLKLNNFLRAVIKIVSSY
jgi:hypothetical protein